MYFLCSPFTCTRAQSWTSKYNEGNSGLWDKVLRNYTLAKCGQLSLVWRWLKKISNRFWNAKATVDFDQLLEMVAVDSQNENSFSTNPQDMHESVLHVCKHPNICKHIHLPVQSGSNRILKEMNRLHTAKNMTLIDIRSIPNGSISQDMIGVSQRKRRRPSRHLELNGVCKI
jgi:tRNA-2-methylthio-N6-dimethylallyladenosine synthase